MAVNLVEQGRETALRHKRLGMGNFGRIAKRTGFTKQHVSRVLRGLREPSFDVAAVIARAAGVTLDELHAHTLQFRIPKFRPRRVDELDVQ